MRRRVKQRPRALAGATCALLCLCFAAGLASCQSPPAAPTLMPGIAEAEQVSVQDEWVWGPEQECAPCHSLEAQTAAASACTGFSSAPSRCLGCHDACQALAAAHEDIRSAWQAPEPAGPEIGKEACARCHDAASLAARTAGSRALVDGNNVTINPHAVSYTHLDVYKRQELGSVGLTSGFDRVTGLMRSSGQLTRLIMWSKVSPKL